MSTEDVAFFRFDNNARENAEQIASGMAQIRDAMGKAIPAPEIAALNTGGYNKVFENALRDFEVGRARLQDSAQRLQSGLIDGKQFRREIDGTITEALRGLPTTMGNSLAQMSDPVRNRVDARSVGRGLASDYVTGFVGELQSLQKQLPALSRFKFKPDTYGATLDQVSERPIAPPTSPIDYLRNRAFVERFVSRNPDSYSDGQRLTGVPLNPEVAEMERNLGIEAMARDIRRTQVRLDAEEGFVFKPSGVEAELKGVEFARRQEETTAYNAQRSMDRQKRETDAAAKSADQLADALRLVDQEARSVSASVFQARDGSFFKRTKDGAEPITNPLELRNARDAIAKQDAAEGKRLYNEDVTLAYAEQKQRLKAEKEAAAASKKAAEEASARLLTEQNARAVSKSVFLTDDGNFYKRTRDGAERITAPLELRNARDDVQRQDDTAFQKLYNADRNEAYAEQARRKQEYQDALREAYPEHARRTDDYLVQNRDRVNRVGAGTGPSGYRELDGQFYRVTKDGAERITRERLILELQEQQNLERAKAAAREAQLVELAQRRAIAEGRAEARLAQRQTQGQAGLLGGFIGRFQRGDQAFSTGFGGQIASAAAFSAAYGSLFAIQHVIRDTLSEFLDYQDSLTDLQVATRDADIVTGSWVNSLSDLSRLSGSNVGAAMDTAARGVRAFADAQSQANEVTQVGTATVEASTQLALIANKELPDATGDVVAIGSAFGLDASQLSGVVDAVANAKRNVGGDAGQISQGLALIALSAQEAGYSLNEAAAVIGLVQARTDQSGQAIATRLTRIFQITKGSTGKRLGNALGVDTTQSVKDQLFDYAEIYSDEGTSDSVRDRITSGLGGTANLRELLPLLTESPRLLEAFSDALSNAGQGEDEFNRKTENLVGTLKQIKGTLSNIQVDLANSGLFDVFGGALKVLEPALYTVSQLLKGYNSFVNAVPGVRTLTGALIDLLLVSKAIAVVQKTNMMFAGGNGIAALAGRAGYTGGAGAGVAGAAGAAAGTLTTRQVVQQGAGRKIMAESAAAAAFAASGRRRSEHWLYKRVPNLGAVAAGAVVPGAQKAALQGQTQLIIAATQQRLIAEGRFTAALALANAQRIAVEQGAGVIGKAAPGTAAAGLGTLKGFFTNPYVLGAMAVIAGAAVIGNQMENDKQLDRAQAKTDAADDTLSRNDGYTSAGLLQSSQDYTAAKGQVSKIEVGRLNSGTKEDLEEKLQDRALQLAIYASSVAREENELAGAAARITNFGSGAIYTMQELAEGLNELAYEGATAYEQMMELGRVLKSEPLDQGEVRFGPEAFKTNLITQLQENFRDAVAYEGEDGEQENRVTAPQASTSSAGIVGGVPRKPITDRDALANIVDPLGQEAAVFAALEAKYAEMDIKAGDILDTSQITELATAGYDALDLNGLEGDFGSLRGKTVEDMVADIARLGRNDSTLNGSGPLTQAQMLEFLNPPEAGEGEDQIPNLLEWMQAGISNVPTNDDGTLLRAGLKSNVDLVQGIINRGIEGTPGVYEQILSDAEFQLASSQVERAETLRKAAESRTTTSAEFDKVRLESAKISVNKANGEVVLMEQIFADLDKDTVDAVISYLRTRKQIARKALQHERRLVEQASALLGADDRRFGAETPEVAPKFEEKFNKADEALDSALKARRRTAFGDGAGGGDELTARQKAARLAAAQNDADRSVAQSILDLESARADLAAVKDTDSAEYFSALAAVRDAEDAVGDAVVSRASAIAQAAAARQGGSGIAAAQASLVTARAELSVATKGTEEYFQALAGLYSAQYEMAEAVRAYASTKDQLTGDFTDPLEQARDAVRAARRKVRDDKRMGAGKDVLAEGRLSVEQAEAAMQQTAFDQRLSDMQTAEKLGQISYQTYIRYLQNEHDRLDKIKDKTRQQQDQLNTIDLALQEANNAMDAQFNFGDINTRGLVYQARRYAAEQRANLEAKGGGVAGSHGDLAARAGGLQQEVRIYIDGADTAKVKKVVEDVLGRASRTRTTQSRRR
jgi:hypothetical protein